MDGDEQITNPAQEIAAEMAAEQAKAKVDPPAAPVEPATEAATEGDTAPAAEETKPATEEKTKRSPWYQKRINDLSEEKKAARAEAEATKQQNAALLEALAAARAQSGDDALPAKPVTEALPANMTEAQIEAAAERKVAAREFNKACDETYAKGVKEFPDFQEALGTFQMLGGLTTDLASAANKFPDGHKILHHLGKNPEEAERILKMPAIDMAIELAEIRGKMTKVTPISKAPAPIKTIEGTAKPAFDMMDKDADMDKFADEYLKMRGKRA